MAELFGLIGPVLLLVLAAAALPRWLARRLGRRPGARALNAALSALALAALAAAAFLALYLARDPGLWTLMRSAPAAALGHFAGLGARAGLIWAPVLAVSLLSLPRR